MKEIMEILEDLMKNGVKANKIKLAFISLVPSVCFILLNVDWFIVLGDVEKTMVLSLISLFSVITLGCINILFIMPEFYDLDKKIEQGINLSSTEEKKMAKTATNVYWAMFFESFIIMALMLLGKLTNDINLSIILICLSLIILIVVNIIKIIIFTIKAIIKWVKNGHKKANVQLKKAIYLILTIFALSMVTIILVISLLIY